MRRVTSFLIIIMVIRLLFASHFFPCSMLHKICFPSPDFLSRGALAVHRNPYPPTHKTKYTENPPTHLYTDTLVVPEEFYFICARLWRCIVLSHDIDYTEQQIFYDIKLQSPKIKLFVRINFSDFFEFFIEF